MKAQINQRDLQGKKHGVWEDYRADGTLSWRAHYHHGKEHGLWEWYNRDGTLQWRAHYHHGVIHGVWESYRVNGTLSDKTFFINIKWKSYHNQLIKETQKVDSTVSGKATTQTAQFIGEDTGITEHHTGPVYTTGQTGSSDGENTGNTEKNTGPVYTTSQTAHHI